MNNVKSLIQKEEYLSLALNKYILQTGTIPKKSDDTLDWDKLMNEDYLGTNFSKTNPYTNKILNVTFDQNNNAFIKGLIETEADYKEKDTYLYNFYINKVFRVNTLVPKDISKTELIKGTQVLYNGVQKEIASILKDGSGKIFLPSQNCNTGEKFYELRDEKLIYKYCKTGGTTLEIYQKAPVYLEDSADLEYVKIGIGEKAYAKENDDWKEYIYLGNDSNDNPIWIKAATGDVTSQTNGDMSMEDRILSYIPDSKDLVLRKDGGCMLANGDIFCWGNNKYKKAGIETYGQLDTSLTPDYINTPVMLKVQVENVLTDTGTLDIQSISWYNNPYRIKFEKVARNDKHVCGISPIFDYYEAGIRYKRGGDLYCNGNVDSAYYELTTTGLTSTSILRKNKVIASGKEAGTFNASSIYLKDVVMVDGTFILLSDTGTIYSVGANLKGALGVNNIDESLYTETPQKINPTDITFKKIYALRDIKGFGALDSNNYFWIWGERPNGKIYYKPTILSNSKKFNENAIFVNSKEFVLKGIDNIFYRTYSDISIKDLGIDGSALSVSVYDYEFNNKELVAYVDKNMQLKGSSELIGCMDKDFETCSSANSTVFSKGFDELNSLTNVINNANYANFLNVSIFESKINKAVIDYGTDYIENFESGVATGWNKSYIHDAGDLGKFFGRFGSGIVDTTTGAQTVYKTIDFGSDWANKHIKISFDMYEIGTWDGNDSTSRGPNGLAERFYVYLDDKLVQSDMYSGDNTYDTKDGTNLGTILDTGGQTGQKHTYLLTYKLNSTGKLKLGFGAVLGESYKNESFGIDNIQITRKIDNATFSSGVYSENFEDSNHDYWITPRGPAPKVESNYTYFTYYPIYTDSGAGTKFLGRFGDLDGYQSIGDGTEEVYKVFSFGSANANKEVTIEYDFYQIDLWKGSVLLGLLTTYTDYFYEFVNGTKTLRYTGGQTTGRTNLDGISNSDSTYDYKFHFSKTEYLDEFGNVRLGFGAKLTNTMDKESWGIDNIKFTLTGRTNSSAPSTTREITVPNVCSMTGFGSSSQMYCWGNVGRSIPILSTSLYDVAKISTINKLFITKESEVKTQMAFDNYNNSGELFLKYPTYIGGFDYEFYFK